MLNATNMPAEMLQYHMRHKSFETTREYIQQATVAAPPLSKLFVPDLPADRLNQVAPRRMVTLSYSEKAIRRKSLSL